MKLAVFRGPSGDDEFTRLCVFSIDSSAQRINFYFRTWFAMASAIQDRIARQLKTENVGTIFSSCPSSNFAEAFREGYN